MIKVLVACEESQIVTKAFRSLGHSAFSCDLQPCSGGHPEWHIHGDCLDYIYDDWDLIIAHPPCTYLCVASAVEFSKHPDLRFPLLLEARDFFLTFYNLPGHVCIENPVPMSRSSLPPYTQLIQPYYFGDPFSKATCLWLKNLPPLFATCFCDSYVSWHDTHSGSVARSRFFPGIASAMASQWGSYLS